MKTIFRVSIGILTFVGCCVTTVYSADIYKWVDKDGNVVYSQTPPPADVETETIKPPPRPETEKALVRLRDLKQRNQVIDRARESKADQEQAVLEQQNQRQENCRKGREMLASFNTRPTVQLEQDDGTQVRATEEQRQQYIRQAQDMIEEFCD